MATGLNDKTEFHIAVHSANKKTTLQKIIEGLTIIQAIEPDTSIRADHDEIWCGEDVSKYSPENQETLEGIGWAGEEGVGWHHYV